MPCVCIVIPLIFYRKVKEEEEAEVEGEVMVKEEEEAGLEGRDCERGGRRYNDTFCACMHTLRDYTLMSLFLFREAK